MIKKIVILIAIISIVSAFRFSIWGAWIVLGFVCASFLLTYWVFHLKSLIGAKDLSPQARRMFKKFSYLYVFPSEDDDLSEATDKLAWAGIILAVVGCFQAFWWGILFATVNYLLMEYLSKRFTWGNFLLEYRDIVAHEEILNYLEHKAEEAHERHEQQHAKAS